MEPDTINPKDLEKKLIFLSSILLKKLRICIKMNFKRVDF